MADMRNADAEVCWAPECTNVPPPSRGSRPSRYCSGRCRVRAVRRNGGKAPSEPYPPLEPLQQDATAAMVVSTPPAATLRPRKAGRKPHGVPSGTPEPDGTTPEQPSANHPDGSAGASVDVTGETPGATEAPATVTQLHIAVTEDATVPVKVKVHPMVAAYKADLAKIGQSDTRQGLQVVEMAEKLVSGATSPAAAANLSKELQRLMGELEEQTIDARVSRDPSLVIRERTLAKLRALEDRAEATA